MKWYLARLVFRVICGDGYHQPQFEEQLRLVFAEDDLHAFHKARLMGDSGSLCKIETAVKWKFIDVAELHLLSDFMDGVEVYSRTEERKDSAGYEDSVRKSAASLFQESLHQFTGLN